MKPYKATFLNGMAGVCEVLRRFFPRWLSRDRRGPRPAPYTAENPPASIAEAHERLQWLKARRKGDWLVNHPKEYERFASMTEEQYQALKPKLRGHVGTVIRADVAERSFLNEWIQREAQRLAKMRRRRRIRGRTPEFPREKRSLPHLTQTRHAPPPAPDRCRGRSPTRKPKR